MDFTRDVEEYVSYQAIEAIKNGIFYNTKYESKMITYNTLTCLDLMFLLLFYPFQEQDCQDFPSSSVLKPALS